MNHTTISLRTFAGLSLLSSALVFGACGDDGHGHGHGGGGEDDAHLMLLTPPPAAMVAGEANDVVWQVHTEGALHITEVHACMGHNDECGLGDASTFDEKFSSTQDGTDYTASVNLDVEGAWTVVVYAHVGETPHISDVTHVTVSATAE